VFFRVVSSEFALGDRAIMRRLGTLYWKKFEMRHQF